MLITHRTHISISGTPSMWKLMNATYIFLCCPVRNLHMQISPELYPTQFSGNIPDQNVSDLNFIIIAYLLQNIATLLGIFCDF